jgi:hypothetical protein
MPDLYELLGTLREIEAVARRLVDMGLIDDASRPLEAHQRATGDSRPMTRPDSPSPALASRRQTAPARERRICAAPDCGRKFLPKGRQVYCSPRCRSRTNMHRSRAREDESWRKRTAELRELHQSEGFAPNGATAEG